MNTHRKELIKLLRQASGRRNLHDVFSDFVTMAAISVANAVDLAQREPREAEYLQTIARYDTAEQALFPRMLATVVGALEAEAGDFLGGVFGELELGNAARGQFFTPDAVCRVMASITVGNALTLECRESWFTPVHIIDGWSWRLAREATPMPAPPAPTTEAPAAPQLALF